ncbi:MAG: hypothetical protein K2F59_04215 [Eubacteriales bacterium]|nr:hypothetical protein [Eubacteriales bacterium]
MGKSKNATKSRKAILGSGKLYVMEFNGALPSDEVIETEANRLGAIKGGATLEYSSENFSDTDDLQEVEAVLITTQQAKLTANLFTWDLDVLNKIIATSEVTDLEPKEEDGFVTEKRQLAILGKDKDNGKKYLVRFVHQSEQVGEIRVTLVGRNESSISFSFTSDAVATLPVEFIARTTALDGNKLAIIEHTTKSKKATDTQELAKATDTQSLAKAKQ